MQYKASRILLTRNAYRMQPIYRQFSQYSDYYTTQGISQEATQQEIHSAYRNQAELYNNSGKSSNSSVNPQVKARFEAVSEAYVVLSDQAMKAEYDSSSLSHRTAFENPYEYKRQEYARTATGEKYTEDSEPTAYHQRLTKTLAGMRKSFHVDSFGRHKGGLPKRNAKYVRGESLGDVGDYMTAQNANSYLNHEGQWEGSTEQIIGNQEADAFANYRNIAALDGNYAEKTWWKAEVDYDIGQMKPWWPYLRVIRNIFALLFASGLVSGLWLTSKSSAYKSFKAKTEDAKAEDWRVEEKDGQKSLSLALSKKSRAYVDGNGVVNIVSNLK